MSVEDRILRQVQQEVVFRTAHVVKRIANMLEKTKDLELVAEQLERPAVPQLYVVTGDKRPPGYNWLSELPEGTTFLTRPHKPAKDQPFLDEYHVIFQFDRATKLMTNLNGIGYLVVDSTLFCNKMELFEVIGKAIEYE